jgi:hypothetical protein
MMARAAAGMIEEAYEGGALRPSWNREMEARGEPPECITPDDDELASSGGVMIVFVTDV